MGEEPLVVGFYGFSPERDAIRENAPRYRWGYRIKALWAMSPDNEDVVTVKGKNVKTGERVWFKIDYDSDVVARFDPKQPSHRAEPEARGWKSWGSYVYFPRAGCYRFVARWARGSWRLVIGFGARR